MFNPFIWTNPAKSFPKTRKQSALLKLVSGLFWVLLILTVLYVVFVIFVPTAQEWDSVTGSVGQFPSGITTSNVTSAIVRHLARFSTNITIQFIVNVINFVFWTMFAYKIEVDISDGIEKHGGNIATYVYVEWALGSLISGIINFSSTVGTASITDKLFGVGAIVIFALIAYFVLYRLMDKLKKESE